MSVTKNDILMVSPVRGLILDGDAGAPGLIVQLHCFLGPDMMMIDAITNDQGLFFFDEQRLPWPCATSPDPLRIRQKLTVLLPAREVIVWEKVRTDQVMHSENDGVPMDLILKLNTFKTGLDLIQTRSH